MLLSMNELELKRDGNWSHAYLKSIGKFHFPMKFMISMLISQGIRSSSMAQPF